MIEPWPSDTDPTMLVVTRGEVMDREVTRLERAITRVLRRHHVACAAQVRVSAPPCGDGQVLVQANIRFRGAQARVQVAGPRGFVATFTAERLDRQLARLTGTGEPRYWPDPARPPLAAVTEERPIVRRKACALAVGDPAAATRAMDAMDYDAHLFIDAQTGHDAVIFWAGPLGVRLARQHLAPPQSEPAQTVPLTVDPRPAPLLTDREAAARLCRYGLPFVFFTEPRSGRGRLLYRRHDGDLAIVLPDEATFGGVSA
ncbi:hypothetical protein DMB37_40035 [Nocardia sp. CS682]|nr:hypothetical protein DMB37_40035 [Nocardia sp. CS682]